MREIEILERQVRRRDHQSFGYLRRIEHRPQRVERDRRAAGIAELADELDQRRVAAERVGAQDGGARIVGLVELHRGQRNGGGGVGALGIELLPAARGLGAGS